jgi:predicted nucleic acid-binding protein
METIITDAGPLVAYLKHDDQHHDWAEEMFQRLTSPLRTCDAALSEAFSSCNKRTAAPAICSLFWSEDSSFQTSTSWPNFPLLGLIRRYESVPMSLTDACLVRMAELHRDAAVFTLDSDFRIYRKHRRQAIALIYPD